MLFSKVFIDNMYIRCPQHYSFAEIARSIYHDFFFANNPFSVFKKIPIYIVCKPL